MGELKGKFKDSSEDIMKGAAGRALQVAVFATRVDTGRARGGWIITLGSTAPGGPATRGADGKFKKAETPEDPSGSSTIAAGQQEIARFRIEDGRITLANNVEYILFLDQGSPTNAADMMVEQATQAAIAFIKQGKFLGS